MAVRRRWWRLGGLVSVALLAGGTYLAVDGYTSTEGPGDAVRGYFAALADSDAPTALAYGSVPSGSDSLLTSAVLREQNRIAALRDVTIGATTRTGSHATVTVRYTLAFPGHPQTLSAQVGVHKAGDDWRLDTIAVATQIELLGAQDRASILGTAIPEGTTLLFPGVVPVRFDTAYLALAPAASAVTFGAQPTTQVSVQASPAGRQAALAWAEWLEPWHLATAALAAGVNIVTGS
ncbi:MAG: hypothetical protein J0H43_02875, partial [Actinobacteria bacterium]|nr:hypothetical protein [Actinomycetota bacterium]